MTNQAKKLILECERRGIELQPKGQMLHIEPAEHTTPELVEQLRQHKFEIIASLESRRIAAALHLSRQVMEGEFLNCGPSTLSQVANQLFRHSIPVCQQAIAKLHKDKHHAND